MRADSIERVHRALEDIRAGRLVILVDDEDRENEGDLCMAVEKVTPEAVNFMAKYARGLICLTLSEEKVRQLDLPMMVDENRSSRTTAFTISIEARHGVTTGISAADRSHTVRTAVAKDARPSDLVSPGHIFPLRARPGGVLQRTGAHRGLRRPRAPRGARCVGRDLRDHERRRHDGADARVQGLRREARPADPLDR